MSCVQTTAPMYSTKLFSICETKFNELRVFSSKPSLPKMTLNKLAMKGVCKLFDRFGSNEKFAPMLCGINSIKEFSIKPPFDVLF